MSRTAVITTRIDPEMKKRLDVILKCLGLSMSEAINIFCSQIILNNGLPFEVKIPSKETIQVLSDTDQGKKLVKCKDVNDLFARLGI
ncbi:MAG: type II toxin-antitoxin system RelB/DinJ family antitoxin [Candidatus Wallbacteria bacterium]|nr:type II toxin-antitoxin system RelB/DinJ family antitoxin [Candidatus Wallbacteria bacterium]